MSANLYRDKSRPISFQAYVVASLYKCAHIHSDTGHYVVAYKFEPGEDTLDDIWVLDPYNPDNASSKGRCHSVQKACTESGCDYIDFITTTKMIST